MTGARPRVIAVMPAYNAARTLERTYRDIPPQVVDHVILVDDVSADETVEVARRLGLKVVVHAQNKGYGANQKTCYLEALKDGAEIVVMIHPDYQYDSRLVPELIAPIVSGEADLVLGSRFLGGGVRQGGMPLYKIAGNRILTWVENLALGLRLSEAHTGFRAFRAELLRTIPFLLNSDDFVFDTQVIFQARAHGFRIAEIGVPTRYFPEASSVGFLRGVKYGLETLLTVLSYVLDRLGLRRQARFREPLRQVLSHYHWEAISPPGSGELPGDPQALSPAIGTPAEPSSRQRDQDEVSAALER